MKKVAFLCFYLFFVINLFAQTAGELTVKTTTSTAGGRYAPANCVAIWVEDGSGNFVKTLMTYAQKYMKYLTYWAQTTSASGSQYNTVDAITGASADNFATYILTWDGTDVDGNLVADGTYYVCMELTDKNATGSYSTFAFTKGTTVDTQTPANVPSFANNSIEWVPVAMPTLYSLTVLNSDKGTIDAAAGDYEEGTELTITAIPDYGYVFSSWTGNCSDQTNPLKLAMNSNITLGALFVAAQQYVVSVSANNGGLLRSEVSGSYFEGENISVTAIPYVGYQFAGWFGSDTSSHPDLNFTVSGDSKYAANFSAIAEPNLYEIEDGYFEDAYAQFGNSYTGYSGTGYVNHVNSAGSWCEITVYAEETGEFACELFMSGGSDRPLAVSVNSVGQVTLTGASTGSSSIWGSESFKLQLAKGENIIRFTGTGTSGGPNLDYILIQKIPDVQRIVLQNGWNLVSFYKTAQDMSVETIFAETGVTAIKTMAEFWMSSYPSYLNSIVELEAGVGYLVYTEHAEDVVIIEGFDYTGDIAFTGSGWNLMAASATPVSISGLDFNYQIIKNFEGSNVPGGNQNTLDSIVPGKAYFIK